MIALLIPASVEEPCRLVDVANSWEALRAAIGAEWIEHVRSWVGSDVVLVVDEEGLLRQRPINAAASSVLYPGTLAGDVLVCGMVQTDDGGDFGPLTEAQQYALRMLGFRFGVEAVAP